MPLLKALSELVCWRSSQGAPEDRRRCRESSASVSHQVGTGDRQKAFVSMIVNGGRWCGVRIVPSSTRGLVRWVPCMWAAQVCTGSCTWRAASEGREALAWCEVVCLCPSVHVLRYLARAGVSALTLLICWQKGITIVRSCRYEGMHQCLSRLSCEIVPHVCNVPAARRRLREKVFGYDGPCWVLGR